MITAPTHPESERQGSYSTSTCLNEHILRALHLAKSDHESKHQQANFVRILMRFPQIRSVFDRLKAIHAKCDVNGDGKISSDELTSAMAELMNEGRESTKPDFVTWILSISEVDEAGEAKGSGLDVKQFIVMCSIGFILAEESKEMLASVDDAYRRAMMDVATAYLSFDREGKGYFTADEFQLVISASERSEATRNVFSDERFAELDVSGDGRVDFEEFVNAFSKWVSDEDEEEDEQDPYLSHKADPHLSRQANLLTPSVLLALLKPNWRRRMRRVSTSRE